jgi:dinuclear metal center YbgI/SA1388 family protein
MPAATTEILAELDRLLDPARFEDYCVNGLQVPGAEQVHTLATGVSASVELFELAAREQADMVLVHHGLFWGSGVRVIDAPLKRRLQILFDARIALAAYHLPLDAHPLVGNNALIAAALGSAELTPFALHRGQPIGFVARLRDKRAAGASSPTAGADAGSAAAGSADATPGDGIPAAALFERVHAITQRQPLVFDAGPPVVRRLAIVSGGGADYLADAVAAGADALLTGEAPERSMADAREAGVHLIAAGHYATETFGVRRLGERLADRYELRHVFLDVPNPI